MVDERIKAAAALQTQRVYELLTLLGYDLSGVPAAFEAHVAALLAAVTTRGATVAELMAQLKAAQLALGAAQSAVAATSELEDLVPMEVSVERYQA